MAKKRAMALDDLFRIRAVGRVAISPDGSRVVFELKRFDLKKNKNFTQLMIVGLKGKPRPLTEGEHNDTLPQWSLDGTRLAFVSDREKAACLYVMPMDGGEPQRLTDRDGSVGDFAWSPDGRRFAFIYQSMSDREKLERDDKKDQLAKQPQYKHITRLFHKLDGDGWWNGHYTHVYVMSAKGGKARQLTRGAYDAREPRFSPDGRLISFISNRSGDPDWDWDQSDIYVVKPGGGRIKRITQSPGYCSAHSWSPDGAAFCYVGNPCKPRQWYKYDEHIWTVPAAGGKARELTRGIDKQCTNTTGGDVASAGFSSSPPLWSPDSSRVYFQVSERGATRIYSISATGRGLLCEFGGDLNVMHMQRTARDGMVALSVGTAPNPADVYVADLTSSDPPAERRRRAQRLTDVNAGLFKRVEVAEPEGFSFMSGKTLLEGWVLKPPGFRKGRKYPAILQIHGGPEAQYGYGFYHELQWLAARGYVVVYANPRGSSGYGFEHMRCIMRDWGNLDYKDAMKITDWIAKRPYVDSKRIGVTGGSYGGFLTNWLIGKTNRYKAAVTQRSCVNWESMLGTSDFGFIIGDEFGGTPWKDHQNLRRQSPLTYVKGIRKHNTPTLIIHSEEDLRCPIEQGEQLFMTMKMLGCTVEFVRFEGEPHGLSRGGRPQNRRERLRRIGDWFDRYLK